MTKVTRYSVGEEIIVGSFGYEQNPANQWNYFKKPVSCSVRTLVVMEHHKVPLASDESGKPDFNGFIAKDKVTGEIYYNQYPQAVYGYLLDNADRMFICQSNPGEEVKRLFTLPELLGVLVSGLYGKIWNHETKKIFQWHYDLFLKEFEKTHPELSLVVEPFTFKNEEGEVTHTIEGTYTVVVKKK